MHKLIFYFIVSIRLVCNLQAGSEKDVDALLDSFARSGWLSCARDLNQNKVFLQTNDDLYKAMRAKLIETLQGKRIHSVVYVCYPDEIGIATITDYDADSVLVRLVNNENGKVDRKKCMIAHGVGNSDIKLEWSSEQIALGARLQMAGRSEIYEDMLQPRLTGLIRACLSYQKRQDRLSIISLHHNKVITSEQAIIAGSYHDFEVYRDVRSFIDEYGTDWSTENNLSFDTWQLQYSSFEEYFYSEDNNKSRLRWNGLVK